MFLATLLFALFASLFTLSKETLQYVDPFFLIGSRMAFAGVLLCGHQLIFNRAQFKLIQAVHIRSLVILGFLAIYLTNIAEIWGIQHMVSSKACLLYSLSPFCTAIMGFLFLKEKMSDKKLWGMFIGFCGLIPIFFTQTLAEIETGTLGVFSYPELALLIAVLCSVYGWILLKKFVTSQEQGGYGYSFVMANGISMLIGGLLALGHSYCSGEVWNPMPVSDVGPFLANSLLMCLISNVICYNLYGYLLRKFTATFMSFAGLVTPLFASLFGWIWLGETISWHFFVSLALFGTGLTIFYREEIKDGTGFRVQTS